MPDFLNSTVLWAALGGFIVMYVYQVLMKGPAEEKQKKRINEYLGRLSEEARGKIEKTIESGDDIGAIKIFREDTNVGLQEGKACIERIKKELVANPAGTDGS